MPQLYTDCVSVRKSVCAPPHATEETRTIGRHAFVERSERAFASDLANGTPPHSFAEAPPRSFAALAGAILLPPPSLLGAAKAL